MAVASAVLDVLDESWDEVDIGVRAIIAHTEGVTSPDMEFDRHIDNKWVPLARRLVLDGFCFH